MEHRVTIRFAEPERDAAEILSIYAPYIEKTAITFETQVPSAAEFKARVAGIAEAFPYLILEIDGRMAGYAYAHRQAERAAFDWNAELSIYLETAWVHKGIGVPLYALLMELLTMQGYVNYYAVITGSNAGSIAMHERMGFTMIGRHSMTGYKFGCWHDTVWMHRRAAGGQPGCIRGIRQIEAQTCAQAVAAAEQRIAQRLCERA